MNHRGGIGLFALAFFTLIGLSWLAAWRLGLLKQRAGVIGEGTAEDKSQKGEYRYRAQLAVLSDGERAFWPALRAALPILTKMAGANEPPLLLAHVRLADVVTPEPFSRGAFAVVSQKHVDFLLCEPVTTRPLPPLPGH